MEEPFEVLFKKSNHKPIEYKGKLVSHTDTIKVPVGKTKFIVRIEQVNSKWQQGILFQSKKDTFHFNNIEYPKGFHLWSTTSDEEIECAIESMTGEFKVWNIWRLEGKSMQYGHNGAALYFEEIPNGRRYFCNDGYPDDDFDDIIFTIEIID